MEIDLATLTKQFESLSRLPPHFDSTVEATHIAQLINTELKPAFKDYEDVRAEGVGGSGVVLSAIFKPFRTRRAIKLPREKIYSENVKGEQAKVPPELEALSKLSHKNITRLYESLELKNAGGYCIITEYVEGSHAIDIFAKEICCSVECRQDETLRAKGLRRLAAVIYDIVDALHYMHATAKLIHFDVKPDNILVSDSNKLFITDLGSARDFTKYNPRQEVSIHFTHKYAHPSVTNPETGLRITSDPAKAKNTILAEQILPFVDLFAFSRTLQEILKTLEDVYKEAIHSDYTFSYLHLVACLCLDGKNTASDRQGRRDFVTDTALGMPTALFRSEKFHEFAEVRSALQRLLGRRRLEDDIPELDSWSATTVNVSDLGVTTLTPRVKALIEHPVLQRLAGEQQLGMLDTVFPTAGHTRLQHSLGTYHALCEYITALYYDPENPTFRTIFKIEKCVAALLAALVHDIGQSTFGHELEEVDAEEFSHERIGELVLERSSLRDNKARTIRDLICGEDHDCWQTRLKDVVALLTGKSTCAFDGVLHDILNGQLDADKLDYLVRDTVETRVKYGHGIDSRRFLRSLTTCAVQQGQNALLKLAIKRKGAASAESFALARYQLYQSLYWHHTMRAIIAMFITATSQSLRDQKAKVQSRDMLEPHPFQSAYLEYVIRLSHDMNIPAKDQSESAKHTKGKKSKKMHTLGELIRQQLQTAQDPQLLSKYAEDRTIQFIWKLATGKSRALLNDLIMRNYYKRVLEIPLSEFSEEGRMYLRETLKGNSRLVLQRRIEESLLNLLRSTIQDQLEVRESLIEDKVLTKTEEIARARFAFIIDLPLSGWTVTDDDPYFVSDYKRRHFRTASGTRDSIERASLWSQHIGPMMRRVAFFRVYCEPDLHSIVRKILSTQAIQNSVAELIEGFPLQQF